MKKLVSLLLTVLVVAAFAVPAFAAPAATHVDEGIVECRDADCDGDHDGIGIAPFWEPCAPGAKGKHGSKTYETFIIRDNKGVGQSVHCYYCDQIISSYYF